MAIAKNFVVRYGLEVDSNLIFADPNINKVGIGTTSPFNTLQVSGGIGATDISISGFGTIPILSGQNLSYNRGNIVDASGLYLNYTGFGTITNLGGIKLSYDQAYINSGIVTNIVSGLGTITTLIGQNLTYHSGIVTDLSGTNLTYHSGIVTNISGTNLSYSGIATVGSFNIGTTNVISADRQLRNILSLDSVTTKTIEEAIANSPNNFTDLNVSGISTLGSVKVDSGIVTSVSGIVTYYGDGTYLDLTENPSTGVGLGVSSGVLGYGITFINFYGTNVLESFYDPNVGIATFHIGTLDNSPMSPFALIKKLDDISTAFNNSTQTFELRMLGDLYQPINSDQILINLGGVIQKPGIDYTISSSNITFTSPPEDGLTFLGLILNEYTEKLIDRLDDISPSFNGITTSFGLAVGGVSTTPVNSHHTLISVGGAVQSPGVDYNVSGSNIIFNQAPASVLSFSGLSFHNIVGISSAVRLLKKVDNFSSSFDGIRRSFALTINSNPVSPFNASQILIVLGGVVQNPGADYQITGSSIVFAHPPSRGLTFFGNIIGSTSSEMPMESLNVTGASILNDVFANALTLSGALSVGNILISSGEIKATSGIVTYYGDGSKLTNVVSNVGIATAGGIVGSGASIIDFRGSGISGVTVSSGIATINITAAAVPNDLQVNNLDVVNQTDLNTLNVSGISTFVGTVNAVNASFSGNVSIAGTLTYEDVTNVDSVGLVTARDGIRIGQSVSIGATLTSEGNASFAGIVTASSFVGDITGTASTATASGTAYGLSGTPNINVGVVTASSFVGDVTGNATGLSGTPNLNVGIITAVSAQFSGNVSVAGTLTYEDVTNIDSIGLVTARSGVRIDNGGLTVTSGISTISGGLDLSNLLREGVNIVAGKLSDNTNINLDNGMVHFFTTTETTTSTPNIISSVGINTQMAVGETSAITIITTAAAAGYSTCINIDGTYNAVKWLGGIQPSTGGASGNDVYSLQIIKTASATYTVLGSVNNFA